MPAPAKKQIPFVDKLKIAKHEILVSCLVVNEILEKKPVIEQDFTRLAQAYRRLSHLAEKL